MGEHEFDFRGISPDAVDNAPVVKGLPTQTVPEVEDLVLDDEVVSLSYEDPEESLVPVKRKHKPHKYHEHYSPESATEIPTPDMLEIGAIPAICAEMPERWKMVCRMFVGGARVLHIADAIKYSAQRVGEILKTAEGRAYVDYLSRNHDKLASEQSALLQLNALKSIVRISEVLHDDKADKKLQMQCAWDLLDRTGHAPVKQVKMNVNADAITSADVARLTEADKFTQEMNRLGENA